MKIVGVFFLQYYTISVFLLQNFTINSMCYLPFNVIICTNLLAILVTLKKLNLYVMHFKWLLKAKMISIIHNVHCNSWYVVNNYNQI